jgi:hypothetical protein
MLVKPYARRSPMSIIWLLSEIILQIPLGLLHLCCRDLTIWVSTSQVPKFVWTNEVSLAKQLLLTPACWNYYWGVEMLQPSDEGLYCHTPVKCMPNSGHMCVPLQKRICILKQRFVYFWKVRTRSAPKLEIESEGLDWVVKCGLRV